MIETYILTTEKLLLLISFNLNSEISEVKIINDNFCIKIAVFNFLVDCQSVIVDKIEFLSTFLIDNN
jgi:hypothetical protein